eukprot:CAMPEP_0114557078 /NCGR_PEP_ID=MMETSP0114-20121206/9631_1 /TAXON_ID=31324 /ORGANISM="Goniomonas sp, Strain m" /LENGTH=222 /DNA_ID=CAMNT_0001742327 /DNA_START=9 /DNA_END=677 /DNA_ORIENTATION=+
MADVSRYITQGLEVQKSLPACIEQLNQGLALFRHEGVNDARAAFASVPPGESNAELNSLEAAVAHALDASCRTLGNLELFVRLQVPKCEDGNNFGVEVQEAVLKQIVEQRKALATHITTLHEFHEKRADKGQKFLKEVSTTKTDTQGGEKPGVSTVVSEKETSSVVADYRDFIVSFDVVTYSRFRQIMTDARDAMIVVADVLHKNKDKVGNPRAGGGGHSMY